MGYEILSLSETRRAIRCASGVTVHVVLDRAEGTWTVEEDPEHHRFLEWCQALDRAREVGKDPEFR